MTSSFSSSLFFIAVTALFSAFVHTAVLGDTVHIKNYDEFVEFSDEVNNGNNYNGTTVLLDSDLDLDGKAFAPIGDYDVYFLGTFDGQGHTFKNLKVNSPSFIFLGLFGYSQGITIRNVVMDSSCSLTSSYVTGGESPLSTTLTLEG